MSLSSRLIRERNERDKAVRLVLQRAQLPQMIHAVGERFDVAVKHRAGAALAELVPGAMHVEIFLGGFLALGDCERTSLRKISAPPPVSEARPASFNSINVCSTDFLASHARCRISIAVKHFNCSRDIQIVFNALQHVRVITERQRRMQSADDVQFRDADLQRFARLLTISSTEN